MASLRSDVVDSGNNVTDSVAQSGGTDWTDLSGLILTKFIQVLEATLILVVTYFIIRIVRKRFQKYETTYDHQKTAINLLEKITSGFILVVGVTLALKTVGLDISLLVGVGLLGLSYGLKDIIKNYIAGILIFLKSPFKLGDIVKIKKFTGKVEKMEFQATTLKTFDNRDITIYNSDIMNQSIENYSRYPMRRMEINVKLGYGTDVDRATRIFDKILANESAVLKTPKYSIVFKSFGDTGITVQLKFWVTMPSNMLKIRSVIAWKIHEAFDEHAVLSPYNRGVEFNNDVSMTAERQERVKAFYANPVMIDLKSPAQTATPNFAVSPELVDADEPSIEEDL